MTMAGSSVCAQVDATGPKPASPTTSSVPKLLSDLRRLATTSGCGSTMRILSGSGIGFSGGLRRRSLAGGHDPTCRDPALALIGQHDLEPVIALADDLQLGAVLHLVEHAGRDGRAAADVGGVDGDDSQVLRQR